MSVSDIIEVDRVSKHFGDVKALDDVSVTVRRGEFFSLLGPSGCGKTTLLRLIAGFEEPTLGTVSIGGEDMSFVPPNLRPTNMVFQNYAIFPHLNVGDNVAFGLRRRKLSRDETRSRVDEALEMVDLAGLNERGAEQLSGGQRQRVALARALVLQPKVLLLDEPLSALDKKLREQMQVELRRLQRAVGITFILVTHDQEEALTMSDRIAVMHDGGIDQVATPFDLYEKPASRRVAGFIGGMNFIDAAIERREGGRIELNGVGLGRFSIPESSAVRSDAKEVTLGIRPERLRLHTERTAKAAKAELVNAIYYGEGTFCDLRAPGREEPLTVAVANSSGHLEIDPGQEVWLTWDEDAMVPLP